MLFVTLGTSLLRNMLKGRGVNKEGDAIIRGGYGSMTVNMVNPLIVLEIQRYCQNEPRFDGICLCDNVPDKIKDGTYVTNLDEYADISTHWIVLHLSDSAKTRFDSFGVVQMKLKILSKNLR